MLVTKFLLYKYQRGTSQCSLQVGWKAGRCIVERRRNQSWYVCNAKDTHRERATGKDEQTKNRSKEAFSVVTVGHSFCSRLIPVTLGRAKFSSVFAGRDSLLSQNLQSNCKIAPWDAVQALNRQPW
jgi:hypothetical protein